MKVYLIWIFVVVAVGWCVGCDGIVIVMWRDAGECMYILCVWMCRKPCWFWNGWLTAGSSFINGVAEWTCALPRQRLDCRLIGIFIQMGVAFLRLWFADMCCFLWLMAVVKASNQHKKRDKGNGWETGGKRVGKGRREEEGRERGASAGHGREYRRRVRSVWPRGRVAGPLLARRWGGGGEVGTDRWDRWPGRRPISDAERQWPKPVGSLVALGRNPRGGLRVAAKETRHG